MTERGWRRVTAATAADVCRKYAPGPEAGAVLTPDAAPRPFLAALAEKELFPDAVRFLAHALPKRESLWWACRCVRQTDAAPGAEQTAALTAVERYCATPTDTNRRAAYDAGEAAGFGTPAGSAAVAAFFSAGSLAPTSEAAPVPPPDHLTAVTAANAIILAAVADPVAAPDKYRKFLELGQAVADGADRWPER